MLSSLKSKAFKSQLNLNLIDYKTVINNCFKIKFKQLLL